MYLYVFYYQTSSPIIYLLFIGVTAIANYTTRVVDTSLSAEQLQEALKFLGVFVVLTCCNK